MDSCIVFWLQKLGRLIIQVSLNPNLLYHVEKYLGFEMGKNQRKARGKGTQYYYWKSTIDLTPMLYLYGAKKHNYSITFTLGALQVSP